MGVCMRCPSVPELSSLVKLHMEREDALITSHPPLCESVLHPGFQGLLWLCPHVQLAVPLLQTLPILSSLLASIAMGASSNWDPTAG